MTDFFISYTRTDRAWAEWIAWQLEDAGYTTVLDVWDFRPGSNFVLAMQQAAAQATCTLAVLSPDYLTALYTQPEWAAAFAQDPTGMQGTLVPVRVRTCALPGMLRAVIYLDLLGLDEAQAKAALLTGVQQERAKPQTAPHFPHASARTVAEPPPFPGTSPLSEGQQESNQRRSRARGSHQATGTHHAFRERLWTWLVRHKAWVFSGIGTALLVALCGYVLSQGKSPSVGRDRNTITHSQGPAIIQTGEGTVNLDKGKTP
jgi:TIR domain